MTRSLNGSAFCWKRAVACLVFASMIFSHQSCRLCAELANKVNSCLPRCLIRNGYMTFSASLGSRTVTGARPDPPEAVLALVLVCASVPGPGDWAVVVLDSPRMSEPPATDFVTVETAMPLTACLTTGSSSKLSRTMRSIGMGFCMLVLASSSHSSNNSPA